MKQFFAMLAALSLLAALTGCGSGGSSGGAMDSLPLTEVRSAQLDQGLTLAAEWPSYASLNSTVYVLMENHTEQTVTTGEDFLLEVDIGNGGEFSWFRLGLKPDMAWTAIGYDIPPGGRAAFACPLSVYETSFLTGGHFRIVKSDLGGQRCAAEFTVSDDAPVSEQRPYGFAALEDLPADYGPEDAVADGCVVFRDGETPANAEKLGLFFEKVRLGIPCQLRTVRLTAEGAPVLEDVVYVEVGCVSRFDWRRDDSRDAMDANPGIGPVFYYSYLQTDGRSITLSNAVEWDRSFGTPNLELLEGEEAEPYIAAVEEMTQAALEGNITRYRVWSADGGRYACLTENPLEFACGSAGYGAVHSLADYDGLDAAIERIRWADDHTLELLVRQLPGPEGDPPAAVYLWDAGTEKLTGTDTAYGAPSVVDPRDL